MKLITSVILSLSLLELFHCVPLISDDGGLKETNTSSSWGLHGGLNGGIGLEAGLKNGVAVLGVNKHLGADIGGDKATSQKNTSYGIYPVPAPNYPYYPTPGPGYYPAQGPIYYPGVGSLNYPATGPLYYPAPGAPYNSQFAPQPVPQWRSPYSQQGPQINPQFPVSSQYTQQGYAPQPAPQGTQFYAAAPAPQYAPA